MPAASKWTEIAQDAGVIVSVEHVLYEAPNNSHFFVHVRIASTRSVAVDLRKYHEVFYPNQWGASATPQRQVIDERRLVLPPFDPAPVLSEFRNGTLVRLTAGTSLDYYEEFNASGRTDVDTQASGFAYVIITMDGQLRISDGTTAERLVSADPGREVAIATPVPWNPVPAGARTITDH